MGSYQLDVTEEEKDLSILVHCKMTMSHPCDAAIKKAKVTLGYIRRDISSKDREALMSLC